MSIGIYKITNLYNNKVYIGQSVHIERRWQEHCCNHSSVISKAIRKYGKENFLFEIIEECNIDLLNERENFWINYYNSYVPNGYNITENTESLHTSYRFIDKEQINNIIKDLKEEKESLKELSIKYNVNISTISRINSGQTHYDKNINYPIRKTYFKKEETTTKKDILVTQENIIKYNYCIDCKTKISKKAIRCNNCENIKRKNNGLSLTPISREELKNRIRTESFTNIAKDFNVSDNAIRKWCVKFNLPKTKKEIKNYSDEDWKNI